MFGINRVTVCANPQCRAETKLSMAGFCATCDWALSQRHELEGQRIENEIKADALKQMDATVEAAAIESKILFERNVKIRADLIKAFRRIQTLESVPLRAEP